jgi:NAD+ diphosphatase
MAVRGLMRGGDAVGFTGAGIDRADRFRFDEARLADLAARDDSRWLRLAPGLEPPLDGDGGLVWSVESVALDQAIFLGLDGETPLFAPVAPPPAPGSRAWRVLGQLGLMSGRDAAIWGAARSLNEWHHGHLFCGRCGAPTSLFRAGWGRRCTGCAAELFPRVDPVVIMLAEHDGKVLVGRQPAYPPGRYSALAGFVEPGESIEEAVARELWEEAGLACGDVRYVASQPWPFPGSLMIACLARASDPNLQLDRDELEDAIWVGRDEVRAALDGNTDAPFLAPPPFAIAHSLLCRWLGQE